MVYPEHIVRGARFRRITTGQVVEIDESQGLKMKGPSEANWHNAVSYLIADDEENDDCYIRTVDDFCEKFEMMSEQG